MSDFAVYAAGFFDGEGCVRIQRGSHPSGKVYYTLHVIVVNTYLPVLQEFQRAFGGVVKARQKVKAHWKQGYMWRVCSRDALAFLQVIRPHLREKQKQADIAIAFQAGMRHLGNRYVTTPPEVVEERQRMFEEITNCKRNGLDAVVVH